METVKTVTIPEELFDSVQSLISATTDLNDKFMPKVNYPSSALDADAITAMNNFGIALRKVQAINF